ncbi:GFA family protein [Mesorhizobium sp. 1M-11]|uniref:GFA family protein n=1 Tax=Mesorhizobium sp. 1M-11 TaxID=1529006 RepID=UPI0006C744DD|nr:GFA family protein [Mesorhizobium sp. 1M-11]
MTGSRVEEKALRLSGGCFCKASRYEVEDAFVYAANCHCSDCQRTTGSAFKPFAGIEREKFRLVTDRDALLIYGDDTTHDSSHNAHCARCGSLLYSVVRDGAFVHIPMGTLIDAPTIRPDHHIFVGSKAAWFTITDDLPQYQEHASE